MSETVEDSQQVDLQASLTYQSEVLRRLIPHAFRFQGQAILFTGVDPYSIEDLISLLPPAVTWVSDETLNIAGGVDLVVVGQHEFVESAIRSALDHISETPRFLPQEGFLDEILFGYDWWNEYVASLNSVLEYHEGLQFVKSLEDFPWPSTEAPESTGQSESVPEFSIETPLFRLGYRITGLPRTRRWIVLVSRALPELGLREVAETIASHVRVRKTQRNGRLKYRHAIREWEHDLEELKSSFYAAHRPPFRWPSTEP